MIGKQLINTLLEIFDASRRSIANCCCCCCNKDDKGHREQWVMDKDLYDFNSDTLTNEYLELG